MSPSIRNFRLLIVASLVIGFSGMLLDLFVPGLVPEEIQGQLDQAYADYSLAGSLAIVLLGFLVFILSAVSLLGLLFLQRWSRPMAMGASILSAGMYPAVGPLLFSGFGAGCFYVSAALWGAVLAAAYWSPIRQHFDLATGPGAE